MKFGVGRDLVEPNLAADPSSPSCSEWQWIVAVLHLVQHLAEVLAKIDGADFGHHTKPPRMIDMVTMIQLYKGLSNPDSVRAK